MSDVARSLGSVAAHFGLGAVSDWAWVARGSMGEVYRLVCGGRPVAVKRQFWGNADDERLRDEIVFADACRAAGVPSPAVLLDSAGDAVYTDPDTGDRWRLYEWVDGEIQRNDDADTGGWLAEQLAVIHALGLPAVADAHVADWYCRVGDRWDSVLAAIDGVNDRWAQTFRDRVAEFRELAQVVDAVAMGALVRCHRDALGGNTLLGADGQRWLIDWENSGAMEPWREVGVLLVHHVRNPSAVAQIAERYRRRGGRDLPADVGLFASGVAIWLNYLQGRAIEAVDASLDPGHREFAAARVSGLVERIPGLAALDVAARATAGLAG